jgi:hypothetical protein
MRRREFLVAAASAVAAGASGRPDVLLAGKLGPLESDDRVGGDRAVLTSAIFSILRPWAP